MALATTLSPATVISPLIVGEVLSFDLDTLPITVSADSATAVVVATIRELGTSALLDVFAVSGSGRTFSGNLSFPAGQGSYTVDLQCHDALGDNYQSISPLTTVSLIRAPQTDADVVLPPTGIRIFRKADLVKVDWQTPTDPGFLGVRVLWSTEQTGLATPFKQWGRVVETRDSSVEEIIGQRKVITKGGGTRTTTIVEDIATYPHSSVSFPRTGTLADTFYVALSTITQDPDNHHVYESYAAGPFECSYVDIQKVQPQDIPGGFRPEDIAGSMISNIIPNYPELDLTPRSEVRDINIDPVAMEIADASTRQWFAMVSESISALARIDDDDQDGVSDDPLQSSYKLSLAKAFRLSSDAVQAMINSRFNILGERCGVERSGMTPAIVDVTFYVMTKPTKRFTVSQGSIIASVPDDTTPSVTFQTMAGAVIDPINADSYYIPDMGWWGVTVPCICQTPGSVGNVGSGTIKTVLTGVIGSMLCFNQSGADFGLDLESNADYAARIQAKQIAGVDTGTRDGYWGIAQSGVGVVKTKVVSSGDLEMLRDWDPLRKKHVYGCVDIYLRSRAMSQNVDVLPYLHDTLGSVGSPEQGVTLQFMDKTNLRFSIEGAVPNSPVCAVIELAAKRLASASLSFYFGTTRAQYDAVTGSIYLNPDDSTYTMVRDAKIPGLVNRAMVDKLVSSMGAYKFYSVVRLWSPQAVAAAKQPVVKVLSVVGSDSLTGAIPKHNIRLIKTEDPLLYGNSIQANNQITVDNTASLTTVDVVFTPTQDSVDLGEGIALNADGFGNPGNVISVRSKDGHVLYAMGATKDYVIVANRSYGSYSIKRVSGSGIPANSSDSVIVAFNRYLFRERLTLVTDEVLTLSKVSQTSTALPGAILNTWLPASHNLRGLLDDPTLVGILESKRYFKIVYTDPTTQQDAVAVEGKDFTLTQGVNGSVGITIPVSGSSTVGALADAPTVKVSYYVAEMFTILSQCPSALLQTQQRIEVSRHACADALVKTMQENSVDIAMTVELLPDADPSTADPKIRTAISVAFSKSNTYLAQADIIEGVNRVQGVRSIRLPLTTMSKSDGSYAIGALLPTGTPWSLVSSLLDPVFAGRSWSPRAYITSKKVLTYSTAPSGGTQDSYVGLLHEGTGYRRCMSLSEFQKATDDAFYIVGVNDRYDSLTSISPDHYGKILVNTVPDVDTRSDLPNPGSRPYRVTYQIFGEVGAHDIPTTPIEYVVPGKITINYTTGSK